MHAEEVDHLFSEQARRLLWPCRASVQYPQDVNADKVQLCNAREKINTASAGEPLLHLDGHLS